MAESCELKSGKVFRFVAKLASWSSRLLILTESISQTKQCPINTSRVQPSDLAALRWMTMSYRGG